MIMVYEHCLIDCILPPAKGEKGGLKGFLKSKRKKNSSAMASADGGPPTEVSHVTTVMCRMYRTYY